jgi:hypothetical protein
MIHGTKPSTILKYLEEGNKEAEDYRTTITSLGATK